jgi:hypothetical protein
VPVRADTPARTRARADVSAARRHEQPAEARQWRDRLPAGGSRVRTERFDPKVNPINPVDSEGKVSGTLAGHQTLIRSEVRRVQAENGTWVRHHTVSLPVRLGEGAQAGDREHLQALVQQALDEHVNDRFALPRSGDQLHVAVEFRDAPKDSEQVTVSRGDHSKPMDQRNWTLDSRENDSRYAAKLVHEVFHYLGARDEEHDTDFVFRRSRESAAVHDVGLMADADDFTPILNRHLAVIEDTTDVTAMVRDHPLTADRTAVRNPEPAPEPRTHPDASDGDDERWSAARAPRGGAAPHPGHINTHVPWDPRAGAPQSGQRPAGSSAHQSRGGSPESGNWTGGEGNPPMAESPRTVSPSDSPTREGGRQNALYSEFGTPNHRGGWSDASGIRHWDADELFAVLERKLNSLPKPHMLFNVQEIVTKHTRRQFTVPQLQRLSRDYAVWRQVNGLRGKWGSDPNLKHVNELYELYKEHDHMREISLDGRIEKWLANGAPLTSRPGANAADLVRLMGLEVKHGGVHDRADFNPVPTRRVDSDPTHLAHQFSTLTTSDGAGRHSTVMPLGAVAVGRVDGPLVSWREAYGNSSARPPHYDAVSALFRMMDADRHPLNLRQLQEVLAEPGHPYVTEMQQHIFNQHGWEMTEMQVRRLNQQYIAWQKMKELPQDYNHDRDVATIEMIWRDHVSYGDLAPGWPTRHPEPGDMSPQAMVDRWLLEGKANRWTENHARDYLDILKDLGYPTGVQRRHTDGGRQAEMGSRGRASRTDPVLAGILTKIENQFDRDQLARRYYSHIPRLFETTPHLANVFKSTPELLHMVLLNPEIANKYKFASEDDLRRYSIRNFLDNHFTVRNGEAALAKYLEYIGVPRSRQESGAVRGGIYPWLLEDAKKAWTHVEANRQMQWVGAAENLRNFDQGNPGTWRFESTVKYGDEGIGENDKLYIKRHLGSLAREGLKGVELHKPREATLGNGRHVSFSFVVTESGMVSPVVHDVKSTPKELYKPSEHRLDRGIVDAIKKLGIHVGLARRDLYVDLPPEELRNMNFATFVRDAGNGYRSFDEALMAYEKGIGITYFDKRFQIGARGEFRYIWEQMHGAGSAGRR